MDEVRMAIVEVHFDSKKKGAEIGVYRMDIGAVLEDYARLESVEDYARYFFSLKEYREVRRRDYVEVDFREKYPESPTQPEYLAIMPDNDSWTKKEFESALRYAIAERIR